MVTFITKFDVPETCTDKKLKKTNKIYSKEMSHISSDSNVITIPPNNRKEKNVIEKHYKAKVTATVVSSWNEMNEMKWNLFPE